MLVEIRIKNRVFAVTVHFNLDVFFELSSTDGVLIIHIRDVNGQSFEQKKNSPRIGKKFGSKALGQKGKKLSMNCIFVYSFTASKAAFINKLWSLPNWLLTSTADFSLWQSEIV